MSRIAILIVAAGKGERTGRAGPKQYESLAGQPMLHRDLLEFLWLVNPIKGVVTHIDVDSFFMLVRGQPASEAVSELLYEWSAPGVSP